MKAILTALCIIIIFFGGFGVGCSGEKENSPAVEAMETRIELLERKVTANSLGVKLNLCLNRDGMYWRGPIEELAVDLEVVKMILYTNEMSIKQ